MTKAKTVVAVYIYIYIDSLNEIEVKDSRDRKNLLFCVMKN